MTLDDLRRNRNLLFWALHTLGWSAYLITQYMGALLYEKPASYVKVILAAAASGFLLSAPLRIVYRRLWGLRPSAVIASTLLAAWITALVWRAVINYSYGHFVGDPLVYRSKQEAEDWIQNRDPLDALEARLTEGGLVSADALREVDGEVAALLAEAVAEAEAAPFPDPSEVATDVYVHP